MITRVLCVIFAAFALVACGVKNDATPAKPADANAPKPGEYRHQ